MSTIRIAKRARFLNVDARTVNDPKLSFRSLGILMWLLNQHDDWHGTSNDIAGPRPEGRDAVRSALKELENHGYIERQKRQGKSGHWEHELVVFERPDLSRLSRNGFPGPGSPAPESQAVKPSKTKESRKPSLQAVPNKPTSHAENEPKEEGGSFNPERLLAELARHLPGTTDLQSPKNKAAVRRLAQLVEATNLPTAEAAQRLVSLPLPMPAKTRSHIAVLLERARDGACFTMVDPADEEMAEKRRAAATAGVNLVRRYRAAAVDDDDIATYVESEFGHGSLHPNPAALAAALAELAVAS